ncbi:pitrilysin family protein [Lipingzhangella sp. LS1_29]|uniref:Pitrilysin family protein n=1 Tax=Lipingzhangella rawalii TaxID=2055835 RepID=A0ABU2H6D7_9ACTN|nr:pitrilysin family protein [Lipingzhangella rawalii]MDS1270572.1 pitrilysin family protein [Lipingzhangella rawalii]
MIAAEQEPGSTQRLVDADAGSGAVHRTVLPGGLRVVTEAVPALRSVAFGVTADTGSRDEDTTHAGAAHFLEHLLFKGTRRRNAQEISALMDGVGADHNAFTTKEQTTFYAKSLDEDLPLAIDVVSDMITSSVLDETEVETERGVILEEIAMYEDEPSELVDDVFAARFFGEIPLGRPILGTRETIGALSRERIREQYANCYVPANLVVSAAGNLDHEQVVDWVAAAFDEQLRAAGDARPAPPRIGGAPVETHPGAALLSRDTEQAHLLLGGSGVSHTDERRHALRVLTCVLGGGPSSRLFQEVRERRGLAYAVHGFTSCYADAGLFQVYVGCLPDKIDEVLSVCRAELADVAAHGVAEGELARAKGQLRGSQVLGTEGASARMSRLTTHELSHPRHYSLAEDLALLDAVTQADVRRVAADILTRPEALAVIGPFPEGRTF